MKDEKSVEIKGCKEVRIGCRRPVPVLERSALRRRGAYIRGPPGLARCIRKHIFVQFGRIEHPKTHQPVKIFPLLFTWSTRLLATGRENVDETDSARSATVYRGYSLDFKWFRFFLSFSWLCLSYFFSFFFVGLGFLTSFRFCDYYARSRVNTVCHEMLWLLFCIFLSSTI